MKLPLEGAGAARACQPLRDLDQIRSFLSTVGPAALFDLPWMPLYLAICFLFHPLIGIAATVGGLILVVVTLLTEVTDAASPRREAAFRAGDAATAWPRPAGATPRSSRRWAWRAGWAPLWSDCNRRLHGRPAARRRHRRRLRRPLARCCAWRCSRRVLGVGAYLVINQQATAGIIIASSILTSRALAPVELAIANWRGFVAARQSWRRLDGLLDMMPAEPTRMALPKPDAFARRSRR